MDIAEHRNGRSATSFYAVLGVSYDSSIVEIRAAYRKLAMKWHPDRCRILDANRRFQQIQEAYEVLSDGRRRALYDARLYNTLNCEQGGVVVDDEGFWDFVQEMVQLMTEVKSKGECTMEELQRMLAEISDGFPVPPFPTPSRTATASSSLRAGSRCARED